VQVISWYSSHNCMLGISDYKHHNDSSFLALGFLWAWPPLNLEVYNAAWNLLCSLNVINDCTKLWQVDARWRPMQSSNALVRGTALLSSNFARLGIRSTYPSHLLTVCFCLKRHRSMSNSLWVALCFCKAYIQSLQGIMSKSYREFAVIFSFYC